VCVCVRVQLQAIASLARDVKNQAKHTLAKAQRKKAQFAISNKELKDFIKKIKDFLTGGSQLSQLIYLPSQ